MKLTEMKIQVNGVMQNRHSQTGTGGQVLSVESGSGAAICLLLLLLLLLLPLLLNIIQTEEHG